VACVLAPALIHFPFQVIHCHYGHFASLYLGEAFAHIGY
jgi:hypothetical protein